ncbi:MAG: hypothetical protein H6641_25710 [Caldilineaceae bacterium]|nr:hypothetical protein [Caldilineaceae bacterium]
MYAQSAEPTLILWPNEPSVGGNLRISSYGLSPGQNVTLVLDGNASISLGQANTGRTGTIPPQTFRLPTDIAAGDYVLSVVNDGGFGLVSTDIVVGPALTIALNPASGAPGTVVNFTVDHIAQGDLQLTYAGLTVFGPVPVSGQSYSGAFVVPNDRPEPLGQPTQVIAQNRRHGLLIAQGEATFQSQATIAADGYRLTNLQIPTAPADFGSTFTIGGAITPPPIGDLEAYDIVPMWQSADGHVFPIGNGPAQIETNGTFSIQAHVPSLFQGDPVAAQNGDKVGLVLTAPNTVPLPSYQEGPKPPDGPSLFVQVIAGDTGQVIEEAKIRVEKHPIIFQAGSVLTGNVSQIGLNTGEELTPEQQQAVKDAQLLCDSLLPPPQNKPIQLKEAIDPTQESFFTLPIYANWLQQNAAPLSAANAQSTQMDAMAGAEAAVGATYRLYIDAIAQGYGEVGSDNKAKVAWTDVIYRSDLKIYTDVTGLPLPNPLQITLSKLPDYAISPLGLVIPMLEGLADVSDASATFGAYYSLKDLPSGIDAPATTNAKVTVNLSLSAYQTYLNDARGAGLRLYIDNKPIGYFKFVFDPNVNCAHKPGEAPGEPFYRGTLTLNNPHLLPVGDLPLRLEAKLKSGQTHHFDYKLGMAALPAWILNTDYKQRKITWSPSKVTLAGVRYSPNESVELNQSLGDDYFGQVNNKSSLDLRYTQTLLSNGTNQPKQSGGTNTVAWNETMPQCSTTTGDCPPSATVAASQVNNTIHIDDAFSSPRVVSPPAELIYGIPVIANVTIGVKTWYEVEVALKGDISLDSIEQGPQVDLTVAPSANAGVDAYGDLTILADIVADAQIHFIPQFGVTVPVRFTNSGIDDANICFGYRLDYAWKGSVGCVPRVCVPFVGCTGGWCAWKDSDIDSIIAPGHIPESSSVCKSPPDPPNPFIVSSASTSSFAAPAISAKPAVATDGVGHTMAVWRTENNEIVVSQYNGLTWSSPFSLTTAVAAAAPGVAFFAPSQAVAVWTQSAILEEPTAALAFEQAIQQQFLAYRVWNGATWSRPQTLVGPTSGDGGVVLAGCASSVTGCPTGGAVTALWIHNAGASFTQHQFQIYSSTFQNGAWSNPQPVDAASNGADGQPLIVYRNGMALAGWVRDADRDFTTANDRQFVLRPLDGSSPASILTDLPNNIVSGSLAVKSSGELVLAFTAANTGALLGPHSDLYVATQTCAQANCIWQIHQLMDVHGRPIRAERPVAVVDNQDQISITFRGLGFGPDNAGQEVVYPEDPPGMAQLTGELAQIEFNNTPQVNINYLSHNGAVNWQPTAIYEPLSNSKLAFAVQNVTASASAASESKSSVSAIASEQPLIVAQTEQLPDFTIRTATILSPAQASELAVELWVENLGLPTVPAAGASAVDLIATWNGGYGIGTPGGTLALPDLGAAQSKKVTFNIAAPPPGLERPQMLFITVNPGQRVEERRLDNNQWRMAVGGLPTPFAVTVATGEEAPTVFLEWESAADTRVAGYRVYRLDANNQRQLAGSTFLPGWVDVQTQPGQSYRYVITSFSSFGNESDPSHIIEIQVPQRPEIQHDFYLPMITR